jgi:hypoxanthine phosphoribosyltransferase
VETLCQKLARQIRTSDYRPDIVIAISRGGYVPARLVCDYLHLMGLTSIKIEHYLMGSQRQKEAVIRYPLKADIRSQNVLVVDDVNDTGDTLKLASEHLRAFRPAQVRTAVLHLKTSTGCEVDYYAKRVIKWRWLIYPWAVYEDISGFLMRHRPRPDSLLTAQTLLKQEYGISISLQRLEDIYQSMGWPV